MYYAPCIQNFAVPHIAVFDITVRENVGVVRVTFERTGGDLSFTSRISAMTVATAGKVGGWGGICYEVYIDD